MRLARVVKRPKEPPKRPHCADCHLTLEYLRNRAESYECSRAACPQRRPVTATAGSMSQQGET